MNFDEFDQVFDRFATSAFRLEALQRYAVDETDEDYLAWKAGEARQDRSVRTSPWLARVARRTLEGKQWSRVHVVDHPLSDYLHYELEAYRENAAAGEEIRIADRAAHESLHELNTDFWLFDADTDSAHAVVITYDDDGNVRAFEPTTSPVDLEQFREWRDLVIRHSEGLNTYLARSGGPGKVA